MRNSFKTVIFSFVFLSAYIFGQNPIIQTAYTADPAPLVYNDQVFLFTGHDEDNSTWFTMNDWKLFTTKDMVNWTEHPAPPSYKTFSWAKADAWAAQCVERNGKFYIYCPVISSENNKPAIGVAVADSPYGPFYDPLGKPLAQSGLGDIDPTVFIYDDGQAYLYWGNPNCYYVKLNEDMISFSGEITSIPMTETSFAKRENNPQRATLYEEGPWLYKRNKLYYLFWAGGPIPEHLGYSTSSSATGPWKYGGTLMSTEGRSFTNHPGILDFKGKTYLFYHNGALPGGSGFTRSVCVDELKFNKDGSISPMKMGDGIAQGISNINPFLKNEGETIAWSEGIKSQQNNQVGVFIKANKNGSYTKIKGVDFQKKGAKKFIARVGTVHNDVSLEIRIDGVNGKLLGTMTIPRTGGSDRWSIKTTEISPITEVHDLYFIFKGKDTITEDLAFFDYWKFE